MIKISLNSQGEKIMSNKNNAKAAEDVLKQGIEALSKNVDNISSFAKENIDAAIQTANIVAKNAEKITAEAINYSKQNIEQNVSAAKEFAAVRSMDQFVTLQTQFSKQAFEQYVQQATKLGDMMIAFSKEASGTINGRFNAFTEQFSNKKAS